MSEQKNLNPFLEENFVAGGGLWDGKVVTFTKVRCRIDLFKNADGTPWNDPKTGKQGSQNVISVVGIADDSDKEREEKYSIGSLVPTDDGLGFKKADGSIGMLGANSNGAKFATHLKIAGFPVESLFENGRVNLSKLDGASFLMKAEARLDKDGKPKVNSKGYTENNFYPEEFKGLKSVASSVAAASAPPSEALKERATAVFTQMLQEAEDNRIGRRDMIRTLSEKLSGDPDAHKIIVLVTKPDFHKDAPWRSDGTGFELIS